MMVSAGAVYRKGFGPALRASTWSRIARLSSLTGRKTPRLSRWSA
jgi:hypothetical protein